MKVLLLTSDSYLATYREFYTGMHKQLGSMDVRRLRSSEQNNLRNYFAKHVDLSKFDRIIINLEFKSLRQQKRFLSSLKNLVFLDADAHENPATGYSLSEHVVFYKKMPWVRIIVRNYRAMRKLQREGLDAWCVAKGFNSAKYQDKQMPRTTDLLVIENSNNSDSQMSKAFIKKLKSRYPHIATEKNILGTNSSLLPQVRIAVCTDIGKREYSGKVFNAMACGCLVMTYDQGDDENFYLSFKDMENIVLFKNFDMFCEKLIQLKMNPQLLNQIARKGHELVIEQHKEANLGRKAGKYIATGLREREDYRIGIAAFGWRF